MKVVVVGAGALGSHLLLVVRNVPAEFTVIDFDRVESKNVLAQFHPRAGLGRNKAVALQQALSGLFAVKLAAVPHRLTQDNVEALLGPADLVVDCLDNAASRRVVQAFVRARGKACLHGAVDADGTFGRVVWDASFVIDEEAAVGQPTCEGGEHLPFLVAVAAHLGLAVRRFVADGSHIGFEVHPGGVTST